MQQVEPRCQLIGRDKLNSWNLNWWEIYESPERLEHGKKHKPREHQKQAISDCITGFEEHDRGRLILPCGTGKTTATLWLAEQQVGVGGRVLYLVPSIALISQSMREWWQHRRLPHRYVAVCSDDTVTQQRKDDDTQDWSLSHLEIPVTTQASEIREELGEPIDAEMMVVFSTYQSLERVASAQAAGAPEFDLVICDEAHRTTGVENVDGTTSPFTLVHDEKRIRAKKRLYTTATSRIYGAGSKERARQSKRQIFSMDDEEIYGPEFHHLTFAKAVENELLCDYRVCILTLDREKMRDLTLGLQAQNPDFVTSLDEDTQIRLIGSWAALADPDGSKLSRMYSGKTGDYTCTSAIAFASKIKTSKDFAAYWNTVIPKYRELQVFQHGAADEGFLNAEVRHIDGTDSAFKRFKRLEWLKETAGLTVDDEDGNRKANILSNARCLTEGVDVPALDAILFIAPRRSQIDIVQAVGRVMRKTEDKAFGHIIIPVVLDGSAGPEAALNSGDFDTVLNVLDALASHDDRLDYETSLELRDKLKDRVKIWPTIDDDEGDPFLEESAQQLALRLADIPPGLIYSRLIRDVGDPNFLPRWAKNAAEIYLVLRERIRKIILDEGEIASFQRFVEELRLTLNPTIGANQAIDFVAQHILTAPVFSALYSGQNFILRNRVAQALNRMAEELDERYQLSQVTYKLEGFYRRAEHYLADLKAEQRQDALLKFYENFFKVALEKEAVRLGVVYTPTPLVDFLLRSADWALQEYFGKRLADEGVHILDPFAGTGTFLTRLIQDEELLPQKALARKYHYELHANEIMLLAYYISWVNIAEALASRNMLPEPCPGLVWTDTFQDAERELARQA